MNRTKRHVVMLSGGLSSAYLAKLILDEHGHEKTLLFFTDTKWEDEDNYRFLDDLSHYLQHEIVRYVDGRTPEDVFWDKRFLGNYGTAPCSRELKVRQTVIFIENLRMEGYEPVLYFGIGKKESHRAERIAQMYSHHCLEPVVSRFPLVDIELDNKELMKVVESDWGIRAPRMYNLGFKHANCGGRCVKGGIGHYQLLHKVWPERFKAQADMEHRFRTEINDYTLLKRKGKPYSLDDLEQTIIQQQTLDLDDGDSIPCSCVFENDVHTESTRKSFNLSGTKLLHSSCDLFGYINGEFNKSGCDYHYDS